MNRQGCSGENVSPRNISIGISRNGLTNGLSEEDEDDLKMELAKTEDEMQTLRQVLLAKEKYAVDIKRQLGMGPFSEIKHNMSKGWHEVQTSNIALPLPSPPRPSLGHSISVPAMRMRHSNTFKSFEDMVGSVKNKVSGSRGNDGNVSGFGRSPSQNNGSF
ncbi:tumor protein D54-like isoform X2 [Oncorhynchus clarkii lewisi]|uniref:tumor protein D54-like isoform X2 n=1 Tax=Oncorhynchus clarkii lewisi TaxID=490388 RepID=UPI0039B94DCC